MNEVLNGLAQVTPAGETIGKLALCPIGTGNDFADMSGARRGVEAFAQRIAAGQTRHVDIGHGTFISGTGSTGGTNKVTRYFGNNVGLGFEAQVTVDSNHIRFVSGPVRYLLAVFKALGHYNSPQAQIGWQQAGGEWQRRNQSAFMISLGNSRRTGGLFYVNPDAVMDDGVLDLALVPHKSYGQVMILLAKVFSGAHRHDRTILFDRCTQLELTCSHPVPVHLDGEVVMNDLTTAHIEILPRRLEIVV